MTRASSSTRLSGFVAALAPVLGGGLFWVLFPAVSSAGFVGVYAAIALAAVTALLAGASASAVGEASAPTTDWLGLGGRVAAVAAVGLIAGTYAWASFARPIAVLLVALVMVVQLRGLRVPVTARLAAVIAVVAALAGTVVMATVAPPIADDQINVPMMGISYGPLSVVVAAALILFALVGQPVPSHRRDRTISMIIAAAVLAAFVPLLLHFGSMISGSAVFLRSLVTGTPVEPVLRIAAVVAGVTSLAALAAGISSILARKAKAGELVGPFATISPRTGTPAVAQLALGVASIVAVMILNIEVLATFAVGTLLVASILQHWRALRTVALPRWIPLLGILLSVLLFAALPWPAITSTATLLAIVLIVRALRSA